MKAIEKIMPNFRDGFDFTMQSKPLESNLQSNQYKSKADTWLKPFELLHRAKGYSRKENYNS